MTEPLRYPTLAAAAQAAIDVQDAVNASGVALSMFEAARTIRAFPDGVPSVNRHPIMQLFAYKLNSLCCMENINDPTYHPALMDCAELVRREKEETSGS